MLGTLLGFPELNKNDWGVYCVTDEAVVDAGVGGIDGVGGCTAGFALILATSSSANGVYPRPLRNVLWVDLNEEDVDDAVPGGTGLLLGRGGIPGRGDRRLGIVVF